MNDNVALSISQFQSAWRLLCGACPAPLIVTDDGVDYIFSNLPVPFFNVGIVTGNNVSAERLTDVGRRSCAWAAAAGAPWLLIVTHETLASGVNASEVLDRCELRPLMPLTAMRAQRVAPLRRTPDELQLATAEDDAACRDVFEINAAAYGEDLASCKPILGKRAFWRDHALSVGRVNGVSTASAAVLMVDGYRYVALVATRPEHQRHGYGEAVMRHALDGAVAAHGDRPTFLHATEAGRPIYARMGYATIANHTAFIEKRFLEGH